MSATAGGRKVSTQDIQLVQNLIERCMQLYMPLKEVVATLQQQAKIEPGFTTLVWHKLEEQNVEFFKAYYMRLKLKDQVVMFNYLLEQQVQMVQKLNMSWMSALMPGMRPPMPGAPGQPPFPFPMPGMPGPSGMMMPPMPMPGMSGMQGVPAPSGPTASGNGNQGGMQGGASPGMGMFPPVNNQPVGGSPMLMGNDDHVFNPEMLAAAFGDGVDVPNGMDLPMLPGSDADLIHSLGLGQSSKHDELPLSMRSLDGAAGVAGTSPAGHHQGAHAMVDMRNNSDAEAGPSMNKVFSFGDFGNFDLPNQHQDGLGAVSLEDVYGEGHGAEGVDVGDLARDFGLDGDLPNGLDFHMGDMTMGK